MVRRFLGGLLVASLFVAPLAADDGKSQSAAGKSSGGKRAVWIAIGAAAGFGAGVFIGLNAFDDAVDSDRKVWTTAIIAAAAGGVAGGLLSGSIGHAAPTRPALAKPRVLDITWASALRGTPVSSPPPAVRPAP